MNEQGLEEINIGLGDDYDEDEETKSLGFT
jgi:hypothetical protein